jgi:copper chaperone CopZ
MKNNIIFSVLVAIFFISSNLYSQNTPDQTDRTFIKIEVKGLACPYCAYGLEKDLKKVEGIEFIEIELKEGLVYTSVPTDLKPTKEKLKKVVEDSGFTAGEVEFSEQPFEKSTTFPKKKKRG